MKVGPFDISHFLLGLLVILVAIRWANIPDDINHVASVPVSPAPSMKDGPFRCRHTLTSAEKIFIGNHRGCESPIPFGGGKRFYCGDASGSIFLVEGNNTVTELANINSNILGMKKDAQGRLLIGSYAGLFLFDPNSPNNAPPELLINSVNGKPTAVVNGVDYVNAAGGENEKVYFTAFTNFTEEDVILTLTRGLPVGGLVEFEPRSGNAEILATGFRFGNGVAVDPSNQFAIVCQTSSFEVTKVWLTGETRGQTEPFLPNLPGFCDGISRDDNGDFWIAFYYVRHWLYDFIHPRPWLKKLSYFIRADLWTPRRPPMGFVMKVSPTGEILDNFCDLTGQFVPQAASVTREMVPAEGIDRLLIGNIKYSFVNVVDLTKIGVEDLC